MRRRGPRSRRQYRLLTGSHGRIENGKNRIIRAGGLLELDEWQAATFGEHRIELVEQEQAATQSSNA